MSSADNICKQFGPRSGLYSADNICNSFEPRLGLQSTDTICKQFRPRSGLSSADNICKQFRPRSGRSSADNICKQFRPRSGLLSPDYCCETVYLSNGVPERISEKVNSRGHKACKITQHANKKLKLNSGSFLSLCTCMLGNFAAFLSSADFFFSNSTF